MHQSGLNWPLDGFRVKISISAVCKCGNVIAGGTKARRGPLMGRLLTARYTEGSNEVDFSEGPYGSRAFDVILNPCCPGKQINLRVFPLPGMTEVAPGMYVANESSSIFAQKNFLQDRESTGLSLDERRCVRCKRFASDSVILADINNDRYYVCASLNDCEQYQREFH
jgi:hypothetical protein